MQPGHEEVAFTLVPDLEVLPAELLDDSNTSAQEMRVRLKKEIRIVCRILFMFLFPKSGKKPYLKEMFGHTLICGANPPAPSVSCFSLLKNVTLSVVSKTRMAMEYSSP